MPGLFTSIAKEDRPTPLSPLHELARQAFSRASGSPLVAGNALRLLLDAQENYGAWLDAIARAQHYIHFETYIFSEDVVGMRFADALLERAKAGVRVHLIYDWLGCRTKASRRFFRRLRDGGVHVRCYNPPRWDAPLAVLGRDHRKTVCVDGEVAFVAGLCVGQEWEGNPARGLAPWRDTGVEVRGPAVASVERAFEAVWSTMGSPIEPHPMRLLPSETCGTTALRVVATEPSTAGMLRIDQLIATLATERLWISDPYYAGTTAFSQALSSAANAGVDVRLLVPGTTDIPVLQLLSRAGYRSLLEAGVRIFEWNGSMMHAKTAVADSQWARVGSTNLNLASWVGNYELDVLVEDENFANLMATTFLNDLCHSTELVLDGGRKLRAPKAVKAGPVLQRGRGSAGRAAASALRIGHAVGAAIANRRVLRSADARITGSTGALLLVLSVLFARFPKLLAYPLVVVSTWGALALLNRALKMRIGARRSARAQKLEAQQSAREQALDESHKL